MYGLIQTTQAPLQTDWCSGDGTGLITYAQRIGTVPPVYIDRIRPYLGSNTPSVYANVNGTASPGNIYTNKRGNLIYSFTKQGDTTGTITTPPPYQDLIEQGTASLGYTIYTFIITDLSTGQQYTFRNFVSWII
jgi:hypothetical protein